MWAISWWYIWRYEDWCFKRLFFPRGNAQRANFGWENQAARVQDNDQTLGDALSCSLCCSHKFLTISWVRILRYEDWCLQCLNFPRGISRFRFLELHTSFYVKGERVKFWEMHSHAVRNMPANFRCFWKGRTGVMGLNVRGKLRFAVILCMQNCKLLLSMWIAYEICMRILVNKKDLKVQHHTGHFLQFHIIIKRWHDRHVHWLCMLWIQEAQFDFIIFNQLQSIECWIAITVCLHVWIVQVPWSPSAVASINISLPYLLKAFGWGPFRPCHAQCPLQETQLLRRVLHPEHLLVLAYPAAHLEAGDPVSVQIPEILQPIKALSAFNFYAGATSERMFPPPVSSAYTNALLWCRWLEGLLEWHQTMV